MRAERTGPGLHLQPLELQLEAAGHEGHTDGKRKER